MILVTGASGNAGGAVLGAAMAGRLPVRAMYRNQHDFPGALKDVAAVIADFSEKASLRPALEGIETVYLVCGPTPLLVELESNMIDACLEAGIHHIVLNSALGAGNFDKSFPSWHLKVEEKLRASGLQYTIIRPNGFMQNIIAFNAASIRLDAAFYAAMGEAKTSLIDVRDIGDAVARMLSEPEQHAGKTYELNGPEAVSNPEIAERISRLTGRLISFVDIPESAQRQAMLGMGLPDWQVTAILELQEYYRSGKCAAVDGTLAHLLGVPPRTLDAYLSENSSAFQPQPN